MHISAMGAHAFAPAVPTLAPDAIMQADASAPAVLADAPLAVMLADARAPAVLAAAQLLLWRLCWQMLVPLHSLGGYIHTYMYTHTHTHRIVTWMPVLFGLM